MLTPDYFDTVERHFRRLHEPAFGAPHAAADPSIRPDGAAIAFTGSVFTELVGRPRTRVCVAEATRVRILTEGAGSQRMPRFSPDGRLLAHLTDAESPGDFQLDVLDVATGTSVWRPRVPGGAVEYLSWSPDGSALLLGVAAYGADLAGGQGSGTIADGPGEMPDWAPEVDSNSSEDGARSVWIAELGTEPGNGTVRQVSRAGTNVWEACWAGPDALVCVAGSGAGEESWYTADLRRIAVADGSETVLRTGGRQFGVPSASPSGRAVAVVEALCSDRGVVAGDLVLIAVDSAGGAADSVRIDTNGVDVTSTGWPAEDRLGWAGIGGLDTVVGEVDRASGKVTEVWRGTETFGGRYPELSFSPHGHAGVRHGWDRFPELAIVAGRSVRTVASLTHPGADYVSAKAGVAEEVTWTAPDGTAIQGILCRPAGPGPFPLITHLHGGPVWSFRNSWSLAFQGTPLLVSRGYAVLNPNPRGSAGRGQRFAEGVFGDMGGAGAQDVLSGIDAMVARGIADPERLGVMGGSYGGFLSAWLITQDERFAAAAPTAPVTDWISLHHTTNMPHFDRTFLADEPRSFTGHYVERSPLRHASNVRTPTLLTGGALDRCTPPGQAREFHRALVESDVESTLVVYPQEGHGVSGFPAVIDHCARVLAWFDAYMAPEPTV
ncbi:alpha/beta hydrolase family protein [Embleya scabrispora]|uniref:S9 family peptidase n=1 Tax=Embleya scabrispora TaxID=159449 RepID=UPI001F1A5BD0|nr:S9 family peptidase [Embleya scabrispora]